MPYILYIEQVVTGWLGDTGFGKWIKEVSDEEFEEIKKNPMQDYINFGVASIEYTRIEAFKKEYIDHKDYSEVRTYKEPIIIEEGELKLDDEELKHFTEMNYEPIH